MLIFPFNQNYKPTFYNMQFTRYPIAANSSILSLCDVTKTLFRISPCLQTGKSFFYSENLKEISTLFSFFFYLGFASRTLKNHRTAREGVGHSINSSLPIPPASEKLRHQPRDYCRELISAHSKQPDHVLTPRFDFHVLTPLITVTKPYVFQCVF